jgi:hypothetical protein
MKIAGYETHPAADLFPMLDGTDLQALADDIKSNGLRNPIVLYHDAVLDGRNRLRACEIAGVTPSFRKWIPVPGTSPITYVVSLNVHRRHLDASQRAMIAADLIPMYEVEAKERQRQGGREKLPAKLPEAGEAREKVAEVVKVSPRLVTDALTVKREAKPDVIEAVKAGKIAVSAAAKETRDANRKERAKDDECHFRKRARSGSASRIPSSVPRFARTSIPEFAVFLSSRFTSDDKKRLGRLLLGEEATS